MRRLALIGLVGCVGSLSSETSSGPDYHPTRDRIRAAPALVVDTPVRGSTKDPTPNIAANCTGGGTAGTWSARAYRFVPPETATYRFGIRAEFAAVIEIGMTREGPQENRDIMCTSGRETLVTLRKGEVYSVIVDGQMQAQGTYELVVSLDGSAKARIRAEDPAIVNALVAAAPPLETGRILGTFESVAAGARPHCGGLGSGTVYRLDVATASTVSLHAITQFPASLELRDHAGASLNCARSAPEQFKVALSLPVPAGSYVVVLDTTDLAPELFDPLRGSPIKVDTPGAGVHAGFALETTVTP
ncbi:MAG TPA: hypothetical protein VFQ65_02105 [Kofleriaceae bacterium]|nr:hypothetical protein [Kofleriaceae bacterium]